jgi:trk system potassium uptake protein TrkH
LSPSRLLAVSFAAAALIGTVLLTLPSATVDHRGLSFVDSFFTAVSAVCVTGLSVIDLGRVLTPFGQIVVMLLIQIGGLGVMTVTTLFVVAAGRRPSLRGALTLSEALGQWKLSSTLRLVRNVAITTLVIEGLGALGLALVFGGDYSWGRSLYLGLFHSVSAFCNAGFDLFGRSFIDYAGNLPLNLIVMILIITGGLGFTVLSELMSFRRGRHLTLHTRIVLRATVALIVVGTLLVLGLEHSNPATLGNMPPGGKVLAAAFQAVTPRTAGFNTVPIGSLAQVTLLVVIILMFIGASPGSTGGGIKTTTFVVILATIRSALYGRHDVEVGTRRLPEDVPVKAWVITVLAAGLVVLVTAALLVTEGLGLMDVLFEAVSAFGTVGLSTGITPQLSTAGRIIIPLLMYAGRVGPLTLAVALTRRRMATGTWQLPEERIIVG